MVNIKIEIDWIRHGYSCSNASKEFGFLILDPVLTDTGVQQADTLNDYIESDKDKHSYDIVCSSILRRAIETASHGFIGQKIYIIPFVSEKKHIELIDNENSSIGIKSIKKYTNTFSVDYSIIDEFIEKGYDVEMPDYNKFINLVLPKIVGMVNKNNIKIAIVSHNNFIRDIVNDNTYNTGIWREYRDTKQRLDIQQIYPGSLAKEEINVERCIKNHKFYDKYMQLKKKYIQLSLKK